MYHFLVIFLVLQSLMIAITFLERSVLKNFIALHDSIPDARTLDDYKSLVRQNMYLALLVIVGYMINFVIGGYLCMISPTGYLPIVVAMYAVSFVAGKMLMTWEQKVRTLPCPDENLQKEYRRVTESWIKKPFPDF